MGYTNETHSEELLIKSHSLGIKDELLLKFLNS